MPFSKHPVFPGILQELFQAAMEQLRLVFLNLDGIQAHVAVQAGKGQEVGINARVLLKGF